MKKNLHIISRVLPDSIGEELELEPGDALLSINGQPVEDVFDYRYLTNLLRSLSERRMARNGNWK